MEQKTLEMFRNTVIQDNDLIWVKPLCDFFKISYENHTRKIKNDSILSNHSIKKSNSLIFSDNYPRILLTKKGFIRWIQLVNPNTIVPHLRKNFEMYQDYIFDYLYGSAEEHANARKNFTRLQKLERLYNKIGNEIKREKQALQDHWARRYTQTSLSFPKQKHLAN